MRRQRILIVDNDEDVLISLERILEENNYDTVTAWSVPADLATSDSEFDLLLIGDHPPDLNCERLLKVLAKQRVRMPVVVLHSAARHPFSEAYLRFLGASGIACKWNDKEVLQAVHLCLQKQPVMAVKPKTMGAAASA